MSSKALIVLFLPILIINNLLWIFATPNEEHPDLRITNIYPTESSEISGPLRLQVQFNQALALDERGLPPTFEISPQMDGTWRWDKNDKTLYFQGDDDVPPASNITLSLPEYDITSTQGSLLTDFSSINWRSAKPQLTAAFSRTHGADRDAIIELAFNQGIRSPDILKFISIKKNTGEVIPYTLHAHPESHIIRLLIERNRALFSSVILELKDGYAGQHGPLLGKSDTRAIQLPKEPTILSVKANTTPYHHQGTISLELNQPISLRDLETVLHIEPRVPLSFNAHHREIIVSGDFKPGQIYQLKLARSADPHIRNRLPRPGSWQVKIPQQAAHFRIPHGSGLLMANGERSILLETLNCTAITAKLHRLDSHNIPVWRGYVNGSRQGIRRLGEHHGQKHISIPDKPGLRQRVRLVFDDLFSQADQHGSPFHKQGIWLLELQGTPNPSSRERSPAWRLRRSVMLSFSNLGITTKIGHKSLDVWLNKLDDGSVLRDHYVHVYDKKHQLLASGQSDKEGFIHVTLPHGSDQAHLLMASPTMINHMQHDSSADIAWVDLQRHRLASLDKQYGIAWQREGYRALISAGRNMVRPGETVQARAIFRDFAGNSPPMIPIRWRLFRPDGNLFHEELRSIESEGVSGWDVNIPAEGLSGIWRMDCTLPGDETSLGSLSLQVTELLPQEIQTSISTLPQTHIARDPRSNIRINIQAKWLFGAPAADAQAELITELRPSHNRPKGWTSWRFGDMENIGLQTQIGLKRSTHPTINLNNSGQGEWVIYPQKLLGKHATRPNEGIWELRVIAGAQGASGRPIYDSKHIIVYSSDYRHAIRTAPSADSSQWNIEVARVNPDGTLATAQSEVVRAQLYRRRWEQTLVERNGTYRWVGKPEIIAIDEPYDLDLRSGSTSLSIPLSNSHDEWMIGLLAEDGTVLCSMGKGSTQLLDRSQPERAVIQVVSLNNNYLDAEAKLHDLLPGDTIGFRVISPFAGRMLLSIEQDTVRWWKQIQMENTSEIHSITVDEDWGPNAVLSAHIIRGLNETPPGEASRARAALPLKMSKTPARLLSVLGHDAEVAPQSKLPVTVALSDQLGNPVAGARVALAIVDEGWLGLNHFKTVDPVAWFMAYRRHGISESDSWLRLLPELPQSPDTVTIGGAAESLASRYQPSSPPQDIRLLAHHSPWLVSDEAGKITYTLPSGDLAGKGRIMVLAAKGKQFAFDEAMVSIRSDMDPLPSWPRFVRPGDHFTLPITIHHRFTQERLIELEPRLPKGWHLAKPLTNLKLVPGEALTLKPELHVGEEIGDAHLAFQITCLAQHQTNDLGQIIQSAPALKRQIDRIIPVRPSFPRVIQSETITISSGKSWTPQQLDHGLHSGSWELRIDPLSSDALQKALQSLNYYPYGCAEQTVSKALPWIALQHPNAGADRQTVQQRIEQAIDRLSLMQTSDGGLAMWPGERRSWQIGSLWAAWFISLAEQQKLTSQQTTLQPLQQWLQQQTTIPVQQLEGADSLIQRAMAHMVLAMNGKGHRADLAAIDHIMSAQEVRYPVELAAMNAVAWLYLGRRDQAMVLLQRAREMGLSERSMGGRLASPAQSRAWLLYAHLEIDPDYAGLADIAQQVEADGAQGWRSTVDRALACYVLSRYRLNLPQTSHEGFTLLKGKEVLLEVPAGGSMHWSYDGPQLPTDLELKLAGHGAAQLTWVASGIPQGAPPAKNKGFDITRQIFTLDNKPITGPLRQGEAYIVELQLRAEESTPHVVIEDRLPAGLECENPLNQGSLAAHQQDQEVDPRWSLLDDRALWFGWVPATFANRQPVRKRYIVRATRTGHFQWPGAHVEAMYDDQRFGRGESSHLHITAPLP